MNKIPTHIKSSSDPVFEFNKAIIDATAEFAVAFKPNIAFYEAQGAKGWESLQKTLEYIPSDIFTIADAKRGDIGNTSSLYARTFFDTYSFDSLTVAPYMGSDSVQPFLDFEGKWVILLALTSNKGGLDFQIIKGGENQEELYKSVLRTSQQWGDANNMMYVVGATKAEYLKEIRKIVPDHFLLVPGVGAQGGSLEEVSKYGFNSDCGLLINASRSIIYASGGTDFADEARKEAERLQQQMKAILDEKDF